MQKSVWAWSVATACLAPYCAWADAPPVTPSLPVATPVNRAVWINENDYPADAIRAGQQGRVAVALYVDNTGRVASCDITASSNSASLDAQTCALIQRRARFLPATTVAGTTFAGVFKTTMTWRLPQDMPAGGTIQAASNQATIPFPSHALREATAVSAGPNRPAWLDSFKPLILHAPFPTLGAIKQKCAIAEPRPGQASGGSTYGGSGPTPLSIDGALTVTPAQAKCLIDSYPNKVFVADAAGSGTLPDAADFRFAAGREAPGEDALAPDGALATFLRGAMDGRKDGPILIYCHNTSCGLSFIAAQRIIKLGYGSVFWMREGTQGWRTAGYPESNKESRWKKPLLASAEQWRACIKAFPAPTDTNDPTAMANAKIRACLTQENAVYTSIGPWFSAKSADGVITSLRKEVVTNMTELAKSRDMESKKLADLEKDDAKWKKISSLSIPLSQTHAVYEICWADIYFVDAKRIPRHQTFITKPHIIQIPNLSDPFALIEYTRLVSNAPSGHGGQFWQYVTSNKLWTQPPPSELQNRNFSCFHASKLDDVEMYRKAAIGDSSDTHMIDWRP